VQEADPTAQLINAFVVPTTDGAAVFVDTPYYDLDAEAGPFQLAIYSPSAMSRGEEAVIRSRVEGDLFAHAVQNVQLGNRWFFELLTGLVGLGIFALLVLFLIINYTIVFVAIFWALPLGFGPPAVKTLRSLRFRRLGKRARSALASGEFLPNSVVGRDGDALARLRELWSVVESNDHALDLMRLEHEARYRARWPGAALFYRELTGLAFLKPSSLRGGLMFNAREWWGPERSPRLIAIRAR
jgi:hypothetical protein